MPIIIAVSLMLVAGGVVFLLGKVSPFQICPFCAGVSGSWIVMTFGILAGYFPFLEYELAVAILMGGTVVGIAYQGELRFRFPVMIIGFGIAYWFLNHLSWLTFGIEIIILAVVGYAYFFRPAGTVARANSPANVKKLEEKLKNCC